MSLATRSRATTPKFGPLAAFARDLAARIQNNMVGRTGSGRSTDAAGSRSREGKSAASKARTGGRQELPRGRGQRAPSGGGTVLTNIADHMLAMRLRNPIEAIEIALLSQAMTDTSGNITAAARLLGIHRKAVERKLAKHRLSKIKFSKQQVPAKAAAARGRKKSRSPRRSSKS